MRLTFSTDYGLRLLMLIGLESDRLVTIEEVADRFHISKNHLMKVAYQLGQAGYLETVRGGVCTGSIKSCCQRKKCIRPRQLYGCKKRSIYGRLY